MGIFELGRYKVIVFAIAGFLMFTAGILIVNFQLAGRFATDAAGLRVTAQQALQPALIYKGSALLVNHLDAGQDIGPEVESLRASAQAFANTFAKLQNGTVAVGDKTVTIGELNTTEAREILGKIGTRWAGYNAKLEPVLLFSGSPYATEEKGRIGLNPRGTRLRASLEELSSYGAQTHVELEKLSGDLALILENSAAKRASSLRIIQVTGILLSLGLFFGILWYFVRNLRKEELISARVRKETQDILHTVNEGLFLLDRDLNIGTERSDALNAIFHRSEFGTFDDLLKPIVNEKTLNTARDYVALLWGERVNEKLVKTINPLNEVEVHFDNPAGGFDTHFLEFDFNRVKSEGALSHLLVTVNDVTKRVLLSRELLDSQEKSQAQLDLLLRILHVEPDSLTSFLTDAEVSLKMVNSILKEPAREESAFRTKIDGIYRQVHAVKGESAALNLKTVEQRAHAFEESLNDLKGRPNLSGSDFLPLVVKLDDLFNHLAQVREMLSRLVDLHQAIATRRGGSKQLEADKVDQFLSGQVDEGALTGTIGGEDASSGLENTLGRLAQRVAQGQSKSVQVNCTGLEEVPERYRRAVKDITIQLVRNAIVHGIETPDDRRKSRKAEAGTLSVSFNNRGADGCELIVQDDGRGLQLEKIKEVAVERGLITQAQAESMEARQAMALIVRPGFSTADSVSSDAGRGAGMDLVRVLVSELGGRVGLASAGGRFAKFKIWLPASERAVAA
jgi:two-component system chemotaxis sensor kinase CheA